MRDTATFQLTRDGDREVLELREAVLRVDSPQGEPLEATLGLQSLRVGSSPDCDVVVLHDGNVSRVHLELSLGTDGIHVKDLGSKNGTLFQGARIKEIVLPQGGSVSLGGSTLTLTPRESLTRVALQATPRFGDALGASPAMRALFALLEQAARSDAPVLLLGETGTGKEVLARALHAHSARRAGPLVVLDCAAIAPTLIEAELFGYKKGAFTGASANRTGLLEQAHGGTLFVDEIGELPLELQARLLRVLETKTVRPLGADAYRPADARIISATHRDLKGRVATRAFREDLYFRLAVVLAAVPPLRERKEDLSLLVEALLQRQVPPRSLDAFPPNLMAVLKAHSWPGNVRELSNTVMRLSLFPSLGAAAVESAPRKASVGGEVYQALMDQPWREARDAAQAQFETTYLRQRLEAHDGNVASAARSMGISRQFLYRLMDAHGMTESAGEDGPDD